MHVRLCYIPIYFIVTSHMQSTACRKVNSQPARQIHVRYNVHLCLGGPQPLLRIGSIDIDHPLVSVLFMPFVHLHHFCRKCLLFTSFCTFYGAWDRKDDLSQLGLTSTHTNNQWDTCTTAICPFTNDTCTCTPDGDTSGVWSYDKVQQKWSGPHRLQLEKGNSM